LDVWSRELNPTEVLEPEFVAHLKSFYDAHASKSPPFGLSYSVFSSWDEVRQMLSQGEVDVACLKELWAEALLERVMARLRLDYEVTGRAAIYQQLQQFIWGGNGELSYEEMGVKLGINEGAVKVAVHRLRQRFREQLHAEVAETVDKESDVDSEIRHLLGMFGS
jgi:hypothetical protein